MRALGERTQRHCQVETVGAPDARDQIRREPDITAVTTIDHGQGRVTVEELEGGLRRIYVEPADEKLFVPIRSCTTKYPLDLIEHVLAVKGLTGLCKQITRDESEKSLALFLHHALLSYIPAEAFPGKRLLDFGCGSGASTIILARMFPRTHIVGVELDEQMVALARHRAAYYEVDTLSFYVSPDANSLPPTIGTFDFVVLSAVWEHLLPHERNTLVPQLWRRLNDGGVLFVNQTPHRWYPIERHTTGLPFLNYVPARVAQRIANRFSKRLPGGESWEQLLRRGIRGGTSREAMGILRRAGDGVPVLLKPTRLGTKDTVDVWYARSQRARPMKSKALMRVTFKIINGITRSTFAPGIDLAIEKRQRR